MNILRHLPNFITFLRLVLAPVALIMFWWVRSSPTVHAWIVALVIGLAVTDIFDGMLARALHAVTNLGKKLDPLADKVVVLLFIPLMIWGMIHFIPVIVIFARDAFSSYLRHTSPRAIAAKFSGKVKTVVNFSFLCLLIAALPVNGSHFSAIAEWRNVLYWSSSILITAVCVWSGADYYYRILVLQHQE